MIKRFICALAVLFTFVACNKPDNEVKLDITGDWQISRIDVKSTALGGVTIDVYLRFEADQSFQIYQMLGSGRYRVYSGTWKLEDNVLTGKYNDGKAWGASYIVSREGDTLTLTSQTSSPETDTYKRTSIPKTVIDTAE